MLMMLVVWYRSVRSTTMPAASVVDGGGGQDALFLERAVWNHTTSLRERRRRRTESLISVTFWRETSSGQLEAHAIRYPKRE